jgi:L-alanine-DL-glutamate epimerase-like enolase superfamily enzyme
MGSVRIQRLRFTPLHIPFKMAFRHASAERAETSSVWVEATSETGLVGHGESCPRPYVTGETVESAREFFARHQESVRAQVSDVESLVAWMDRHRDDMSANPAAWCAIELAILELVSVEAGVTVEVLLGLPRLEGSFGYTAVLGDMDPAAFEAMVGRYRGFGFTDFKVKLSGSLDRDRQKADVLRQLTGVRVRVDANNLWKTADEAIRFLEALAYPFFAVEEPIGPGEYSGLRRTGERLACKVILDESLQQASQFEHLAADPDRWLVNLRVSKMGGLLRSLAVVSAARAARIGLIVGAQVGETSLLTRAALSVAMASRDVLVAQEGAFGTLLLERDVCDPPLMFGVGGALDVASFLSLSEPGFGLPFLEPAV